jgi:uncharacterized membrane protein
MERFIINENADAYIRDVEVNEERRFLVLSIEDYSMRIYAHQAKQLYAWLTKWLEENKEKDNGKG